MRMIENWKACLWRYWSTRIQMLAVAIQTWLIVDPVSLLGLLQMLPGNVRAVLPERLVSILGTVLVALSLATIFARGVSQPKAEAKGCEDADDAA